MPSVPATGWSLVSTTGPVYRGTPGLVYDGIDGYVLLFGGGWSGGAGTNDTWTFHAGTWTNISSQISTAPSPREDAAVAYDAADHEVVLFGGYTDYPGGSPYLLNDTWTYASGVWTNVTSSAGNAPAPRLYGVLTYDSADQEVILFGGDSLVFGLTLSDTWAFYQGTWHDITPVVGTPPPDTGTAAAAYDPATHSLICHVGYDDWSFSNNTWTALPAGGAPPPSVRGEMITYSDRGYLLMTGGVDTSWVAYNSTWAFNGSAWTDISSESALAPPGVWFGGLVNDSSDGVALFFGGCTAQGCNSANGQTWQFNYAVPLTVSLQAPDGEVGVPLSLTTVAQGGGLVYPFYNYSGLPPGCASANVSVLVCTPSVPGNYSVTVQVTDQLGYTNASSPANLTIALHVVVGLAASRSAMDVGTTVDLTASVSLGRGPFVLSYLGLPPGCTSANTVLLSCTPTGNGSYAVTAFVSDAAGGNATSGGVALLIGSAPALSITPSIQGGVAPLTIPFQAGPSGGSGSYSISWSFGDGATATGGSPTHTFTAVGSYTVGAFVNDSVGGSARAFSTVVVTTPLVVTLDLAPAAIDVGQSVVLTVHASGGGAPYATVWTGLPSACNALNATSYSCQAGAAGSTSVSVNVSDRWGTYALGSGTLVVNPALTASISGTVAASSCDGPFTAQLTSFVAGGTTPLSYAWTWGDLSAGLVGAVHPEHNYSAAGRYPVSLTVTDGAGAQVVAWTNVTVAPPPCSSTNPQSLSVPWLYVGIGAVVIVAVAVVLLLRRRSPGS